MLHHVRKELHNSIKRDDWTISSLAKASNIPIERLQSLYDGSADVTLLEFISLSQVLHWDVNKILDLPEYPIAEIEMDALLQIEVIRVARRIPKQHREKFLKALVYLADCFRK